MRSVIFDLDGTLADTSGDLIEAANACFRSLGHGEMLEPVADATTSFLGGRAMLRLGFERLGMSGEALEQAVAREYAPFLTYYETALDVYTDIYPGVEATLERLRAEVERLLATPPDDYAGSTAETRHDGSIDPAS